MSEHLNLIDECYYMPQILDIFLLTLHPTFLNFSCRLNLTQTIQLDDNLSKSSFIRNGTSVNVLFI